MKFRLIRPFHRNRLFSAPNSVSLGYQLNHDHGFWDWAAVVWKGRIIGIMKATWLPAFWWLVDRDELPLGIGHFFDPQSKWSQYCTSEPLRHWDIDVYLEIVTIVERGGKNAQKNNTTIFEAVVGQK